MGNKHSTTSIENQNSNASTNSQNSHNQYNNSNHDDKEINSVNKYSTSHMFLNSGLNVISKMFKEIEQKDHTIDKFTFNNLFKVSYICMNTCV